MIQAPDDTLGQAGAIPYAIVAIDPLDVLVTLAARGGSPALFALGVILTAGASLLAVEASGSRSATSD